MQLDGPTFIPKAVLTTGRVLHQPFEIPTEMTKSALLQGGTAHAAVGALNKAAADAVEALQPRGPAKWLLPIFAKVDAATTKSDAIAQRNKAVFWDPFSQGVEGVGRAIASPGTYWYLRKAGVEQPTQDMIKAVLNMPLFSFPSAPPAADGGGDAAAAAAAQEAAAQQAAAQAAEGAGEVAAGEQQAAA